VEVRNELTKEEASYLFETKIFPRIQKPESGCWEFLGGRSTRGYGEIQLRRHRYGTHQISYFAHFEVTDLFILHRCDNPPCCNPEHLFAGTAQENVWDSLEKGRRVGCKGQNNGQAKLTEKQVLEIKETLKLSTVRGIYARLAREYNVSDGLIHMIGNGRRWGHLREVV
jgi:hypothetical protein